MMQQLESALTMLADRAEDLPTDVLIARLEAQLEAESQIPATPPAVARRWRTNWLVAVGAAVAVFILIGGVVWLIGGTGSDVIDEPTETTPVTESASEPTFREVEWSLLVDDWGSGVHSISMYLEVLNLTASQTEGVSGQLIWDETMVDLCNIGIDELDGAMSFGDTFQTSEGCGSNPTAMQDAFDRYDWPQSACVNVRFDGTVHERCAPLNPDFPGRALSVPILEQKQVLYGSGDIDCPDHWAHDQSLPVGTVEFEGGEGIFAVVVDLTAAASSSDCRVEIWEPETCQAFTPLPFEGEVPRIVTTGSSGSGRLEFVVEGVNPGVHRLNVNVVHDDREDSFPEVEDTRLWEIGGAGFSLVEVRPSRLNPVGPTEPDGVFTWEDGIFEWITADEMEAMMKSLSKRYAGVDAADESWSLEVELKPSKYGDSTHWRFSSNDLAEPNWEASAWEDLTWDAISAAGEKTDPRLPEGVVFRNDWAPGYILKGPNSDEAIAIGLSPPDEPKPPNIPIPERSEPYYDMYCEFASWMLRELRWAD